MRRFRRRRNVRSINATSVSSNNAPANATTAYELVFMAASLMAVSQDKTVKHILLHGVDVLGDVLLTGGAGGNMAVLHEGAYIAEINQAGVSAYTTLSPFAANEWTAGSSDLAWPRRRLFHRMTGVQTVAGNTASTGNNWMDLRCRAKRKITPEEALIWHLDFVNLSSAIAPFSWSVQFIAHVELIS